MPDPNHPNADSPGDPRTDQPSNPHRTGFGRSAQRERTRSTAPDQTGSSRQLSDSNHSNLIAPPSRPSLAPTTRIPRQTLSSFPHGVSALRSRPTTRQRTHADPPLVVLAEFRHSSPNNQQPRGPRLRPSISNHRPPLPRAQLVPGTRPPTPIDSWAPNLTPNPADHPHTSMGAGPTGLTRPTALGRCPRAVCARPRGPSHPESSQTLPGYAATQVFATTRTTSGGLAIQALAPSPRTAHAKTLSASTFSMPPDISRSDAQRR